MLTGCKDISLFIKTERLVNLNWFTCFYRFATNSQTSGSSQLFATVQILVYFIRKDGNTDR